MQRLLPDLHTDALFSAVPVEALYDGVVREIELVDEDHVAATHGGHQGPVLPRKRRSDGRRRLGKLRAGGSGSFHFAWKCSSGIFSRKRRLQEGGADSTHSAMQCPAMNSVQVTSSSIAIHTIRIMLSMQLGPCTPDSFMPLPSAAATFSNDPRALAAPAATAVTASRPLPALVPLSGYAGSPWSANRVCTARV